jgi:hypothetical protein
MLGRAARRGVGSQSAGQWLSKLQQEYGSKLLPTHRISLDLLHRSVAPCVFFCACCAAFALLTPRARRFPDAAARTTRRT